MFGEPTCKKTSTTKSGQDLPVYENPIWRLELPPEEDRLGLAEGLIRKSPKRIQTTQEGTFDDYRKCDKARRDFDAAHPTGGMQWVCACQGVLHSDKGQDKRKRVTGVAAKITCL